MDSLRRTALLALLCAVALGGCLTTPVPVPPTVDVDLVNVAPVDDIDAPVFVVSGGPGTISPPDTLIRITADLDETTDDPFVELLPNDDGSFSVQMTGLDGGLYYVEAITDDDDIFLVAFTAGLGGAEVASPGDDGDGDGSPDAIDCAPEDDQYRGRRCP